MCPTSRRGHTATLVVGRRVTEAGIGTPLQGATGTIATPGGSGGGRGESSEAGGSQIGGDPRAGDRKNLSPPRGRTARGHGQMTPPRGWTSDQKSDEKPHREKGNNRRKGVEEEGEEEKASCLSREMFVIGGAGTDPIRVRESLESMSGDWGLVQY